LSFYGQEALGRSTNLWQKNVVTNNGQASNGDIFRLTPNFLNMSDNPNTCQVFYSL